MTEARCGEPTRRGTPCKRRRTPGATTCPLHSPEALASTEDRKEHALRVLAVVFTWEAAAAAVGVTRQTLLGWRAEDPVFGVECENARDAAIERVEGATIERAVGKPYVETTRERVEIRDADGNVTGSEMVVTKTVNKILYSDKAAAMIMAARDPRYRAGYLEPVAPIRDPAKEAAARALLEDPVAAKAIRDAIRRTS